MQTKNKANELYITRIYNAPVEVVWEAWTEPDQVVKWWGPRGFTITHHSKDLRVGGHWKYTMHGPDGVDYPNLTKYFEVEKYSRLVYDHGGSETNPPLFRVEVTFHALKKKTKMEMTMTFSSSEKAQEIKKFIKLAGGNATWDRLAEYLEQTLNHKEKFVINRSFDAPQEIVFKMWTDPDHLSKWLSPTGTEMKFFKADIKAGGSSFYTMFSANMKLYGRIQYKEVKAPDLVTYTQQFCDENEKVCRHPMAPTWPETMFTTIEFATEENNKTRVTVTWEPFGEVTQEEVEAFVKARSGMTGGWTGSFDKLEDYLANDLRL